MSEVLAQIETLCVWIENNHARLSDFCVQMLVARAWMLKDKNNRFRCLEVLRPVAESRNIITSYRDHIKLEYETKPAQKSHSKPNYAALPNSEHRLNKD